jgi:hypothetical protein
VSAVAALGRVQDDEDVPRVDVDLGDGIAPRAVRGGPLVDAEALGEDGGSVVVPARPGTSTHTTPPLSSSMSSSAGACRSTPSPDGRRTSTSAVSRSSAVLISVFR